jgi:diketogulonate reductase-like aldo/keto reductase
VRECVQCICGTPARYAFSMVRDPRRKQPQVTLGDATRVPALGLDTWHMGEATSTFRREVDALRAGLDLGMTLVDTAEMYGEGGAERVVADAIAGRDGVFVVSKVYPHNAGARSMMAACKRSLARLRLPVLDLYLLHWRGRIPLAETVDAFVRLVQDGLIRRWGVSNFDVDDMEALFAVPHGARCAANQVLYNLAERAPDWRLRDWCRARGVALMAYSPLGQGPLLRSRRLAAIARQVPCTSAQLALAWLLARGAIVIPKSSDVAHVRDNFGATSVTLSASVLAALDRAFPPPRQPATISVI